MVVVLDPQVKSPDLSAPQVARFLKLAESKSCEIKIQGTRFLEEEVLYQSTSKEHQKGDVRTPAQEKDSLLVIAISPDRSLAVQAFWEGGKFIMTWWGGPAMGSREIVRSNKITDAYSALKEVMK